MKWRHKMNFVDQFNDMVQKHGRTHEQQLLLCYELLKKQKPTSSPLGAAAKLWSENLPLTPEAKCKAEDAATCKEIIDNVACTYNLAKATRSADSITTRNTMLTAMAPQSPSKIKNKYVNRFCRVFQVKQDRRRFALNLRQASVAKKKIINGTEKELLQRYQIKGHSCYSPDFIRGLRQWLLEKCDFIQPSPNARNTVTVTDPETGEKMLVRKYLLVGSMNDAYQQFISKGRNGCDLAYDSDDELVVRDTTFRKFFPREITHATDTQKITCGCEVCIISGSMIKDLHVWEREHLKKLNRAFGQCQTDIIVHSLCVLGVSFVRNPSLDHSLDAPLKQGDFRESSMIFLQPSHSDCLEFGAIILAQGVQRAHDYVLIFGGEVPPVPTNFFGCSVHQ
jgi:hypothetical protein